MRGYRFDETENEFIRLDGGKTYVRKFEVVGLFWKEFIMEDDNPEGERGWRLQAYFSDAPTMYFYGENARAMMRAFDLPEDPPDGSPVDDIRM